MPIKEEFLWYWGRTWYLDCTAIRPSEFLMFRKFQDLSKSTALQNLIAWFCRHGPTGTSGC